MFARLKQLFREGEAETVAAIPPGQRVYAVGDIHGRRDLFQMMVEAIEEDDRSSPPAETTVILLGDLVDRGPDSAGVIQLTREWQERRCVRVIAGNHEEMFLTSFHDEDMLRHFLRHGGRETVLSFGVTPEDLRSATFEEVQALMDRAVPAETRAFLDGFEDKIAIGDYLFVHAGIDPALSLDEQPVETLRWIREPFLSHSDSHGPVVVHGHSITKEVEDRGNRIGIDTGAYASGRLTALVLEGTQRRYLQTVQEEDGTILAGPRAVAA